MLFLILQINGIGSITYMYTGFTWGGALYVVDDKNSGIRWGGAGVVRLWVTSLRCMIIQSERTEHK